MSRLLLFFLLSISFCEAKLPLEEEKREFLVLPSPGNSSGMFSVFLTVLGFLHFYDESDWAGISIDFGEKGLYHDLAVGPNWWNYYFAPLKLGGDEDAHVKRVSHKRIHRFNKQATYQMSRERGHALIQKYIKIQPSIEKKVEDFSALHFQKRPVIGVHYRGTDKKSEAKRVSYQKMFSEVRRLLSTVGQGCTLFVATDEEPFLKEISAEFKERIVYIQAERSKGEKPVHFAKKEQYAIGEQALIDCLLLSRSDYLVRTSSNLSFSAEFFNPSLPVVLVRHK